MNPDVNHCPACGEETLIGLVTREIGKQMIVEVYHCNVCSKDWSRWIEQKHKPFKNE